MCHLWNINYKQGDSYDYQEQQTNETGSGRIVPRDARGVRFLRERSEVKYEI